MVPVLLSDKLDCKSTIITRDKEVHYMIINESVHQGVITTVTSEGEIDSSIILGDFSTLLSITHKTARQKINTETAD